METAVLTPDKRLNLLTQSAISEAGIVSYQVRNGIPASILTPQQFRPFDPNAAPPRSELLRTPEAQEFRRLVQETERQNYSNFRRTLREATPQQLQLMERYASEHKVPDLISRQVTQALQARGIQPDRSVTPSGVRQPPRSLPRTAPTSQDNYPALRTLETSGARASGTTATATPRPALPSHWNLRQPPNSPPPPPTSRNVPQPMTAPPTSLPQAAARGRLATGITGGVLDLGYRVAMGQDLGQAAFAAAGGVAGGLAGQGLGTFVGAGLGFALGGPAGAALGGTLGGWIGAFAGGAAGSQAASAFYPGNNAPLPANSLPGWESPQPIPQPIMTQPGVPARAIPLSVVPRRFGPPSSDTYDPSRPVTGTIRYEVKYTYFYGGISQENNPLSADAGVDAWGPIRVTAWFERWAGFATRGTWYVRIFHYGSAYSSRLNTETQTTITSTGWIQHAPRDFRVRPFGNSALPFNNFFPFASWPPTPQRSARPHRANSPQQQYFPNAVTRSSPSPTAQPGNQPAPERLGALEPEMQPQRSPDSAPSPSPQGQRVLPRSGTGPGRNNMFSALPYVLGLAPSLLLAPRRVTVFRSNGLRRIPATVPRGAGTGTPPAPPTDPAQPCRGNACAQQQLQGINNLNNRLGRLEGLLLGGGEVASTAAILRKLEQIDNKLGPQLPNGGIGNFLKRFWDNMGFSKILNILTFITTLHNAKMLSQDIFETLMIAIEEGLRAGRWDSFLKDAEGNSISLSEWVGNSIESFIKSVLGDDTVEQIKLKWQRLNRIYQAASNLLFAFQSILFSIQEALEVIGSWIAKIGNALKRYGVVFEKAYEWFNPRPDFSNKWFTRLERAEELANALATVTSSVREVQESLEYFNESREELRNQLAQGLETEERKLPENEPAKQNQEEAKEDSKPPEIEDTDVYSAEGDDTP